MNRAITLLLAGLFATAPAPGQAAEAGRPGPSSAVQEHRLENGLQVLLLEDHSAPVATFSVFYRVGSRNETTGNTGAAHLLEHMMFKGTSRFKKGEIMAALDRVGSQWNASTYYDYTNYYETVPISRLEFAVELEADRMQGSLILDQERDLERIVVRNELERGENSPTRSLLHDLWAAAYKAHPYHHPVIGWRSDVEGVPTSKLRDFYRVFYQPDNATVVVVGDFKAADALALVRKHFGKLRGGHTFPKVYTVEPPQRGPRRITLEKPGDMKVVALGFKAPSASDPDMVPLKLLHLVLTGELDLGPFGDPLDPGISNRLYQALVEKELATYASVDYVPLKDPGLFTVMALPQPEVDHQKVEDAIRAQIQRLRDDLVSDAELAQAKTRAAAAYGLQQDGTSGRAMLLGYFAAIADWRLADEFPRRVQAVTAEDLRRVARKYLTDQHLTVGWFVPKGGETASAAPSKPLGRAESYRGFDGLTDLTAAAAPAPKKGLPAPGSAPGASAGVVRTVLPNGLTLLVKESRGSPTVSISGVIKAGGALDPPGKPGVAEMAAEMLMRGTTRSSKIQIAQRLEAVGASLEYAGGAEVVSVSARGLSADFDLLVDLLAETMTSPAFPPDEVEKLKRQVIAQIQQAEDSPTTRARRAFYQGLYPKDHPYYIYPLEQEIAAVQAITPEALRAFHQQRYGAEAVVIAVVGAVDAKAAVGALEKRLGSMPRCGVAKVEIPAVPVRERAAREVVFVPDKDNVDVMIGTQGSVQRTDPAYYPAQLANFIFGGSASSRLFQEVRDRQGLTYGIYSTLSAGYGPGPWSVWMTLNPENVEKAIGIVERMSRELAEKGVTDRELADAKETLAGRFQVGLATNAGLAGVLAAFESYGFPPDFVDRHPGLIRAVTRQQVGEVLRASFHPDRALTVIGGTWPPNRAEAGKQAQPPGTGGGGQ